MGEVLGIGVLVLLIWMFSACNSKSSVLYGHKDSIRRFEDSLVHVLGVVILGGAMLMTLLLPPFLIYLGFR